MFIIALIVVVGVVTYFRFKLKPPQYQESKNYNKTSQTISAPGYEKFFLTSIPKSIENLTLEDLPDYKEIQGAAKFKGNIWMSGDGSVIEYNPESRKILSYSDPIKANCDRNLVLVNNFIFVPCHIDNIEDAFGHTEQLEGKIYAGHYAVFKINPLTHKVEHVFSKEDGLQNGYNYELVADGDTVWIETFKGIGRIDSKTNEVSFYPESQIGVSFGLGSILPDKDYVWGHSLDTGLALFDKAAKTWRKFTSEETIGGQGETRLDFRGGIKLVQGGFEAGIYAGDQATDNCLIRKYDYTAKQWSTVFSQQVKYVTNCEDLLKPQFPQYFYYTKTDQDGLNQLALPNPSGEVSNYQLDGRANLVLSPIINGKRYILTNATVDLLDSSLNIPELYIKLGKNIEGGSPHSINQGTINLLIDPESLLGVVIDSGCGPSSFCGESKIWLLDLKNAKILKDFNSVFKSDSANNSFFSLDKWTLRKQQNVLTLNDENARPKVSIDTESLKISILK